MKLFLNDRFKVSHGVYKKEVISIRYYINEQPKGREVKAETAISSLDSLYDFTVGKVNKSTNPSYDLNEFINAIGNKIWKESHIDWSSYSRPPSGFEKETILVSIAEISNLLCQEIRESVGSVGLKFDVIRIFIEPEKTHLEKNENFKANVFFGIYSSNYRNQFTITVDGSEIDFKNGLGYIDLTPKEKCKNSITLKATSKINSEYWKGWSMERQIDYYVK